MNQVIMIVCAAADDAAPIASVLALNRDDPGLYQKPEKAIHRALTDFLVARDDAGKTIGCAALHQESPELAEVYAVAVVPECQGQGIGRQLMQACQQRAVSSGMRYLWLATIKPEYFSRYGFQPISRWDLPVSSLLRKLRQTFWAACRPLAAGVVRTAHIYAV